MNNIFIKSFILAMMSCIILKNILKVNTETSNIITMMLIIAFIFWNRLNRVENMEEVIIEEEIPEEELAYTCGTVPNTPQKYDLTHIEEDTGNTGLVFNNNMPGYYLLNDNHFSNDGISYDKALSIIQDSKYNDLLEQHNYNITWSPHTHIGKNRGHMNWDINYS